METNDFLDHQLGSSSPQGGLSSEDKSYLETAAKWAKFLGIVGFVFTGLIVLAAFGMFAMGSALSSAIPEGRGIMGSIIGPGVGLMYLALATPHFFISLYMYNFADKTKKALSSNNSEVLTEAFKNLKNYFRLMGILVLIIIILYVVMLFLFMMLSVSSFSR